MGQKKGSGKLPIISFYRVVTVSIATIRFSMAVESSCQAQVSQHPPTNISIASVNNATWSLLVAEGQTDGQSTRYKLDSAIIDRYFGNVNHPPDTNRNLTQQNMNSIFRDLIISDRSGLALVQNLSNRELSPYPLATAVNVANVVSNWEGTVIHRSTTYSSNSVKYLPTDRYTEKVTSVTYMTIRYSNVTTPADPYVEESASGIYDPFLWWQIFVGVGYNSYQLFSNQQYAVWRPIIGGSIKLFGGFDLTPSADSANYDVIAFDYLANEYSQKSRVYFNAPPSWTALFGYG